MQRSSDKKKRRPKVALVLGGGGARGLAHLGVLKTLEAADIVPDVVVGSSMGALVGACYCLGEDLAALEAEAVGLTKRKAAQEFLDLAVPKYSVLKGKKIHRYIDRLLKRAGFDEVLRPLLVIATDLADGQAVVLSRGDLAKAIQASIAVPGILPPVKEGDRYLIDGGVASPTPIAEAIAWGADIVIAVDLVIKRGTKLEAQPGLIGTLLQSYEIIRNKSVMDVDDDHENIVIIRPDLNGNGVINSFKFYDIQGFIDAGAAAAAKALPAIRSRIDNF